MNSLRILFWLADILEDVVAPTGGCCLALRAAARSSRFLISNCFASSGVGSLGVPPLDPVEELEPVLAIGGGGGAG